MTPEGNTTDAALLSVRGLSFARGARPVLRDISFSLCEGQRVALIGNNGAGKSTLLRVLAGVSGSELAEATVHHGNTALADLGPEARTRAFAWLPQALPRDDHYGVGAFLRLGNWAPLHTAVVDIALALFRAEHLATRDLVTLSGGEWRRVQLAKTWLASARVLLLDEPSAGLDLAHVRALRQAMDSFCAPGCGRGILFASHDLAFVARAATHVAVLNAGRLAFYGTFDAFRTEGIAATLFGIDIGWIAAPRDAKKEGEGGTVWHPLASL